jgi:quinol-cytochrome oxidoreductase complex cytochrome b subunit
MEAIAWGLMVVAAVIVYAILDTIKKHDANQKWKRWYSFFAAGICLVLSLFLSLAGKVELSIGDVFINAGLIYAIEHLCGVQLVKLLQDRVGGTK